MIDRDELAERIRQAFAWSGEGIDFTRVEREQGEQFDAWLRDRDARTAADAVAGVTRCNTFDADGHP